MNVSQIVVYGVYIYNKGYRLGFVGITTRCMWYQVPLFMMYWCVLCRMANIKETYQSGMYAERSTYTSPTQPPKRSINRSIEQIVHVMRLLNNRQSGALGSTRTTVAFRACNPACFLEKTTKERKHHPEFSGTARWRSTAWCLPIRTSLNVLWNGATKQEGSSPEGAFSPRPPALAPCRQTAAGCQRARL